MAGSDTESVAGGDLTFGIAIGTFGSEEWRERGRVVAREHVHGADKVVAVHGATLAAARNKAAELLDTDWLVFLDADDALSMDYCEEMRDSAIPGCLLQPATVGIQNGQTDDTPVMIPSANLYQRNYLVIGTAVERELFRRAGGFRELNALEDWDLWIRCVILGAAVLRVPAALYFVRVRPLSRNQDVRKHGHVYGEIKRKYAPYAQVLARHTVY